MTKPITMLCTYKTKPGTEDRFVALLAKHWPALRSVDLATEVPAVAWRATDKDGTTYFVETFQWKTAGSSDTAHQMPEVMAVWEPMGALCSHMNFAVIEQVELPY